MGDFKVGDEVVLIDNWSNYNGRSFTIKRIKKNYTYLDEKTTRIDFMESRIWAEPHEIRLLTPLEKAMK